MACYNSFSSCSNLSNFSRIGCRNCFISCFIRCLSCCPRSFSSLRLTSTYKLWATVASNSRLRKLRLIFFSPFVVWEAQKGPMFGGRKLVKTPKCGKNTPRNCFSFGKIRYRHQLISFLLRLHQGRPRLFVFLFVKG